MTGSGRKAEKLGIEIWGGCDRVEIEDNAVDHWLSIGGCSRVAARRNTVREKTGDVAFLGLEAIGQDIVATDNSVDGGQQIGISVSNDAGNRHQYFARNTVQDMVQWGAQIQGDRAGARMLYFYRNRFLATRRGTPGAIYPGADGRGFRFNGNCQQVTLDSNEIRDNRAEGIELGGKGLDQISIVGNILRGNAASAVTGDPGADLEWANNTVTGNGEDRQLTSRGFPDPKPVADFACPLAAAVGETVKFTSAAKSEVGIGHVLWDLGEGVPSTGTEASHAYSRAGSYRVTMVVWDRKGRGAIKERAIAVK